MKDDVMESPIIRIPVTTLRQEYRDARRRSHCENAAKFDRLVKAYLAQHQLSETPENWVKGAQEVPIPCRRCAGTGRFITGTTNGQPTGPGGICYRCGGKGWQNDADARRNYGADRHQKVYLQ